jgi:hypothetical protein
MWDGVSDNANDLMSWELEVLVYTLSFLLMPRAAVSLVLPCRTELSLPWISPSFLPACLSSSTVHFFSSVLREGADEILDPVHLLRGGVGLILCSAISWLLQVGFWTSLTSPCCGESMRVLRVRQQLKG